MDYQKQLLFKTIQLHNILPVTSRCNTSCIFCSHRHNPPGVKVYKFGHLPWELIEELAPFLDGQRKIVIGESATRLIEGEPFTHPDFIKILWKLRELYPQTPLSITTNGTLLTKEIVRHLADLQPIEIHYSINAMNPSLRKSLMGIGEGMKPQQVMDFLAARGIVYHGSVVSMNWIYGWEDLEQLLTNAQEKGAATVRVFMPGYTKLSPDSLIFPDDFSQILTSKIKMYRESFKVPITLEPPFVTDLVPVISGVIQGSPADACGMKPGDIVLKVDGYPVRTRVEAFNLIKSNGTSDILFSRSGEANTLRLVKGSNQSSGLVMDYDVDPLLVEYIEKAVSRSKTHRAWVFASKLGAPIMEKALAAGDNHNSSIKIITVENQYFGGSIKAAGLLTVDDFLLAYSRIKGETNRGDLLLLPGIAFDHLGRDLTDTSYYMVEEVSGLATMLI
ncbi:MAG: DUF512 domain-containing protein [Bacillota bacterium]